MGSDETLLKRLLSHDRQAVKEFYTTYSGRLMAFIRRKVESLEDTEEIAQDTLFAFLEGMRDFDLRCSLNTYLCAIASNKIVDYYRRRKLKKIVFSQLPKGFEPLISELSDPQKMLDNSFVAQKITHVFKKLTPHYARILHLKYVEGRSVIEIAKLLTCSFKSAESILFRARKTFVKLYTNT